MFLTRRFCERLREQLLGGRLHLPGAVARVDAVAHHGAFVEGASDPSLQQFRVVA